MVRCCLRRVPSAANCFAAAAHWGHILVIRSLIHLRFSFVSVSIKLFSSSNLISAGFKRRQCIISNCCYCKQHCRANNAGSCHVGVGSSVQTDATTPNNVGPTMLGVVALVLAVVCKRMQRLPTMLGQQCWELSRWCWQWCANGFNNSQQCWDLQCIRGRIQPISLWKPSVIRVRGTNNVGRAEQTDPTLLRYASAIAEQKKCLESLAKSLTTHQFKTLRNNYQQSVQTNNNVGSCWSTMLRPFARGLNQ